MSDLEVPAEDVAYQPSLVKPEPQEGFFGVVQDTTELMPHLQGIARVTEMLMPSQEGYDPLQEPSLKGYEHYAPWLRDARSPAEFNAMLSRYKDNEARRERVSVNGSLFTDLLVGVTDPVNLIPVGGAIGKGLVKGALGGALVNAGLTVPLHAVSHGLDPTNPMTLKEELFYSTIFGGVLGGLAGSVHAIGDYHGTVGRISRSFAEREAELDGSLNPRVGVDGSLQPGPEPMRVYEANPSNGNEGFTSALGLERLTGMGNVFNPLKTPVGWAVNSGVRAYQELALMLGGDYALKLKDNEAGVATPRSAYLEAGQWRAAAADTLNGFWQAYSEYLGKPSPVQVAGVGVSAQMARLGGFGRKITGRRRADGKMEFEEFLRAGMWAHQTDKLEPNVAKMQSLGFDTSPEALAAVAKGVKTARAFFDKADQAATGAGFIKESYRDRVNRRLKLHDANEAEIKRLSDIQNRTPVEEAELRRRTETMRPRLTGKVPEREFLQRKYDDLIQSYRDGRAKGMSHEELRPIAQMLSILEEQGIGQRPLQPGGPKATVSNPDTAVNPDLVNPYANANPSGPPAFDLGLVANDPGQHEFASRSIRELEVEHARTVEEQAKRERLLGNDEELAAYAADKGLSVDEMAELLATNHATNAPELAKLTAYLASPEAKARKAQERERAGSIKFDEIHDAEILEDGPPPEEVPRPAGLSATGGWKIHLNLNGDEALGQEISAGLTHQHKVGKNSGQSGKDVTIYVGSRDEANALAQHLSETYGDRLGEVTGEAKIDDIELAPKVAARFDADGDADFHQYGGNGHPVLKDLIQWTEGKGAGWTPNDLKVSEAELARRYGEFYTGKKEPTPQTGVLRDESGLKAGHELIPANDDTQLGGPETDPHYLPRVWNTEKVRADADALRAVFNQWADDQGKARLSDDEWTSVLTGILEEKRAPGDGVEPRTPVGGFWRQSRKLDIPNAYVADFIEDNLGELVMQYANRFGPGLEVHKKFGERDAMDAIDAAILQGIREGHGGATVEQLLAKASEAEGQFQYVRDQTLGDLHKDDVLTMGQVVAETAKAYTSTVLLGKVVFSQLPELVRPLMTHGFQRNFQFITDNMIGNLEGFQKAGKDLRSIMGEAIDTVLGLTAQRYFEFGDFGRPGSTAAWRARQRMSPFMKFAHGPWYVMNLMGPVTDITKNYVAVMSSHFLIDDMRRLVEGRASQRTADNLAALGIDVGTAGRMLMQPTEKSGRLHLANLAGWQDQELAVRFASAVRGDVNRAINTPSPQSQSAISQGFLHYGDGRRKFALVTLPFQFMGWGLSAAQKISMSALQGRDANALGGIAGLMGAAYLTQWLKSDQASWDKTPMSERLYRAVDQSGALAFAGNLNSLVETASMGHAGVRPAFGMEPGYGEPDAADAAGTLAGPFGSRVAQAYKAFTDPDMDGWQRASVLRRAIPTNGLIYTDRLWKGVQRSAFDLFETE